MPPSNRARALALVITTLIVALLAVSAVFSFLGRGPGWLSARAAPGDVSGAPAFRPDLAGVAGVNLTPAELQSADLGNRLSWLEQQGITWVRVRLPWNEVEQERGRWDWTAWDRTFDVLAQHSALHVLTVLDGSPEWARPAVDAGNPLAPPQTRADFGAFVGLAARRYGGQVHYFQVWDEPNIAPHWGARPVDPAGYVGLLREAAAQIRSAAPDAKIVLAALAPNIEPGGANQSDIDYLDGIYADGGRAWFDIVAAEPYGFSEPAYAEPDPGRLNFGRAALMYQVMARHGDAGTPVWATGYGWNSLPASWTGPASPWGQVTEAQQAQYAGDALDVAATRWPWLGVLFWSTDCPPVTAGDPRQGFDLCRPDGSARPVAQTLSSAARRPAVLAPGDHPVDDPMLRYGPGWRITPSAADPTASGNRLDFSFYGTGLALRIQGGTFWAYDLISIDGQPANALPRDENGQAYLVLADPLGEVRVAPVARGLPLGEHQVTLQTMGGWDQWALQGILVYGTEPAAVQPLGWLALLAVAGVVWGWLAWPWRLAAGRRLARVRAWAADLPAPVLWAVAILLAAALALSDRLIVALPALAGLLVLFVVQPALALPLIAASIPLWPRGRPLLRWQFSEYELLLWLGLAGLALHWLIRRFETKSAGSISAEPGPAVSPAVSPAGLDWPVLALAGAGLAATIAAERFGVAVREFRTVFLDATLFYVLITRAPVFMRRRGTGADQAATFSPWPLVDGLLAGMVIVSVLAVWQLLTGQGRIDVEGVWRVRALYGSPNNLALVLERAVPLALAVALFGGRGAGEDGPAGLRRRWLYGLAAAIMAAVCVATFSKGSLLLGLPAGVGLVLLLGAWRAGRRWPLIALAAGAVVSAVALALLFRTPRFADLLNFQAGTSFIRLKLWRGALNMALDHPWLGVGPDNFLYAYRTHYVLPSAWEELNLSHPHNILLDMWTRLGIVGLVAGLWAVVTAFRATWRCLRRPGIWPLALGLLGGLAATVAHGLIDNSLFLIDLMALFMLALALLNRLQCDKKRAPDSV